MRFGLSVNCVKSANSLCSINESEAPESARALIFLSCREIGILNTCGFDVLALIIILALSILFTDALIKSTGTNIGQFSRGGRLTLIFVVSSLTGFPECFLFEAIGVVAWR